MPDLGGVALLVISSDPVNLPFQFRRAPGSFQDLSSLLGLLPAQSRDKLWPAHRAPLPLQLQLLLPSLHRPSPLLLLGFPPFRVILILDSFLSPFSTRRLFSFLSTSLSLPSRWSRPSFTPTPPTSSTRMPSSSTIPHTRRQTSPFLHSQLSQSSSPRK